MIRCFTFSWMDEIIAITPPHPIQYTFIVLFSVLDNQKLCQVHSTTPTQHFKYLLTCKS